MCIRDSTTLDGMSWTEDAVAQEKGHGGWMVDLSIGKSVRLKAVSYTHLLPVSQRMAECQRERILQPTGERYGMAELLQR